MYIKKIASKFTLSVEFVTVFIFRYFQIADRLFGNYANTFLGPCLMAVYTYVYLFSTFLPYSTVGTICILPSPDLKFTIIRNCFNVPKVPELITTKSWPTPHHSKTVVHYELFPWYQDFHLVLPALDNHNSPFPWFPIIIIPTMD